MCTQHHFCHHVEDLSGSALTVQTKQGFKEQGFPRRWKNVSSQAVKRQKHVHSVDKQPGGSPSSSRSSTSEKTLTPLLPDPGTLTPPWPGPRRLASAPRWCCFFRSFSTMQPVPAHAPPMSLIETWRSLGSTWR